MTAGTRSHLLHAALLHDSAEEFAAAAVPFLAEGLAAGETVVLACAQEDNTLLGRALGGSGRILRLPHEEVYTGNSHALATYRRLMHRQSAAGVPGVRLVGSLPLEQHPEQWNEWHRYEAVFNVAMATMPLSAVCAYDRRTISDGKLAGVEQTHPALLTPAGPVPNDRYLEPASVLRRAPCRPVDAPPDSPPTLVLADLDDVTRLPELRARVRAALEGGGSHGQQRGRFTAAVIEVIGNAFRHGDPPIDVRLWITSTRLEATVTDGGQGFDDPLAGYIPPGTGSSAVGVGLWVARQACDTVEAFPTPTGFAVHLATALARPDATPDHVVPTDPVTERAGRARADARRLARWLQGRVDMR